MYLQGKFLDTFERRDHFMIDTWRYKSEHLIFGGNLGKFLYLSYISQYQHKTALIVKNHLKLGLFNYQLAISTMNTLLYPVRLELRHLVDIWLI